MIIAKNNLNYIHNKEINTHKNTYIYLKPIYVKKFKQIRKTIR